MVVSVPAPVYRGLGWKEGDLLKLIVGEAEIVVRKERAHR